ncbi:MAG: FAD binding domain-containing protein [Gemmatimonadota bacterium]|nr:FAD binding domain-containing protein [Gemmatimonadota bacterium]
MRGATSSLSLLEPRSLEDALRMMRDEGPLTPLAGATDLYVSLNFGTLRETRFVDLWKLDSLRGIERRDGDVLSLGAMCTYTQLIGSPLVREWLPMLVDASREVGGAQIQNRGTIGGNIANGSPAGDSLPVFAAAGATVVLRSAGETRRIPFENYYTGYRASVRRPDELIVAIELPRIGGAQWFRKVGTRAAQAISKVVMAAVRLPDGAPCIALGSVAATVVRLPRTEAALGGGATIADAQRVLAGEISPTDDVRSTAVYRSQVCLNLLARFWGDTEESSNAR